MERQCDCCPNPAVVHETIVHDGFKTEVHLCVEHAQERGYVLPTGAGPALVIGKIAVGAQVAAARAARACPDCGTTMANVRETGLVGCPRCYREFEPELGPVIERAQGGASVHAGRHPAHAADLVDRAALRNRLVRELRDAVAREEFERAARVRDRLKSLGIAAAEAISLDDDEAGAEEGGAPR